MTFRIPEIDTPVDDPFKHDALDREEIAGFLARLIERTGGQPLVMALDGPYGSGKTVFVRMLRAVLEAKCYQTIYFNAWQVDHISDPLVAMVAALDEAMPKGTAASNTLNASLRAVRKVTGLVAKRGAVAVAKIASAGVLDLEEIGDDIKDAMKDLAGETTGDIVEKFQKQTQLNSCFHIELHKVIDQLESAGKQPTLVFFVDELDRCRPDFAISLLERIKHMFDVPNIVFVLSVDKAQLEAATAAVYGERINAAEYLRKFIDFDFGLPMPSTERFVDSTVTRAGLDELFAARAGGYETARDRSDFVRFLSLMAQLLGLTLRAQERCVTRLKLVLDQTPPNHYLHPIHVALLVVVRATDQAMFNRIVHGEAAPDDVLAFFGAKPGAVKLLASSEGRVLRALLIAEDRNEDRRSRALEALRANINDESATTQERNEASNLESMIGSFIQGRGRPGSTLAYTAAKIDIAARIRD